MVVVVVVEVGVVPMGRMRKAAPKTARDWGWWG